MSQSNSTVTIISNSLNVTRGVNSASDLIAIVADQSVGTVAVIVNRLDILTIQASKLVLDVTQLVVNITDLFIQVINGLTVIFNGALILGNAVTKVFDLLIDTVDAVL